MTYASDSYVDVVVVLLMGVSKSAGDSVVVFFFLDFSCSFSTTLVAVPEYCRRQMDHVHVDLFSWLGHSCKLSIAFSEFPRAPPPKGFN